MGIFTPKEGVNNEWVIYCNNCDNRKIIKLNLNSKNRYKEDFQKFINDIYDNFVFFLDSQISVYCKDCAEEKKSKRFSILRKLFIKKSTKKLTKKHLKKIIRSYILIENNIKLK